MGGHTLAEDSPDDKMRSLASAAASTAPPGCCGALRLAGVGELMSQRPGPLAPAQGPLDVARHCYSPE
eukprot:6868235-Alexandrium_andersonii.AAC.1